MDTNHVIELLVTLPADGTVVFEAGARDGDTAFENRLRALCERYGYWLDEVDGALVTRRNLTAFFLRCEGIGWDHDDVCTLADFLADNEDDDYVRDAVLGLKYGASTSFEGNGSNDMKVTLLLADETGEEVGDDYKADRAALADAFGADIGCNADWANSAWAMGHGVFVLETDDACTYEVVRRTTNANNENYYEILVEPTVDVDAAIHGARIAYCRLKTAAA